MDEKNLQYINTPISTPTPIYIISQIIYLHSLHTMILIFCSYLYIIAKRNNHIYRTYQELFTINQNLIDFIKYAIRSVLLEELLFRVYLTEFIGYFFVSPTNTQLVSSICFSLGHSINYYWAKKQKINNIRMTIAQIIYTFILSFYYLQKTSPLLSLLLHQYTNLCCIGIQHYFYKYNRNLI